MESRLSQQQGSGLVEARTSQGNSPSGAKAAEAESEERVTASNEAQTTHSRVEKSATARGTPAQCFSR